MQYKLSVLEKKSKKQRILEYPHHSRIHSLKTIYKLDFKCYIKREDELGLFGSKIRKLSSLIFYLLEEKAQEAVVIGSANSNHVLGLTQLLIENGIHPRLFLLESHHPETKGNALLTQLLVPRNKIRWVTRQEWPQMMKIAQAYVNETARKKVVIIPEGGCMPQALPGALSLVCDTALNEQQLGFQFNHLFIDSGTGLMAIAFLLGLAFLQHPGHVHVVLIAGKKEEFLDQLKNFHLHFSSFMEQECPLPTHFSLHYPHQAKSFGSTTKETFRMIEHLAQNEGVLCDPIYNAKLFLEAQHCITTQNLRGNALIIQSGGTLSLPGFL
jgi:1-aminocyclopropane-1-carboxylate deaminase